MRTGGLIVIESFGEEETVVNRPPTAIDPGRLRAAFKDTVALPDWGGPAKRRLVRMVAEKRP
jgi:hypothetical protein